MASVPACDTCLCLFQLLNSLARDLDHMLNDLSLDQDSAPPPPTEAFPVTRSATYPVTRSVAVT